MEQEKKSDGQKDFCMASSAHRKASQHTARRPTRRPSARRRPDPKCVTCKGTGRLVSIGKADEVPVHCPRCMGPSSIHTVPVLEAPQHAMYVF